MLSQQSRRRWYALHKFAVSTQTGQSEENPRATSSEATEIQEVEYENRCILVYRTRETSRSSVYRIFITLRVGSLLGPSRGVLPHEVELGHISA